MAIGVLLPSLDSSALKYLKGKGYKVLPKETDELDAQGTRSIACFAHQESRVMVGGYLG